MRSGTRRIEKHYIYINFCISTPKGISGTKKKKKRAKVALNFAHSAVPDRFENCPLPQIFSREINFKGALRKCHNSYQQQQDFLYLFCLLKRRNSGQVAHYNCQVIISGKRKSTIGITISIDEFRKNNIFF